MALKKFKDARGQHLRIYMSLLDSSAWQALNFSQQALFVACRRKLNSNNNGNLSFTLNGLKEWGFASSATLASGLRALQAVGFIAVSREGGKVNRGQAIARLYRFTDEDAHEWRNLGIPMTKATNNWRRFESLEAARKAIVTADAKARTDYATAKTEREKRRARKNSPIQKLNRASSNSEAVPIQNLKPVAISSFRN